jgi:hypothetical protein
MLAVESTYASRAAISADLAAAISADLAAAISADLAAAISADLAAALDADHRRRLAAFCMPHVTTCSHVSTCSHVTTCSYVTTCSHLGAGHAGRCKAVTLPPPTGAVSGAAAGAARAPGGGDTGAQHGARYVARYGARDSGDGWVGLWPLGARAFPTARAARVPTARAARVPTAHVAHRHERRLRPRAVRKDGVGFGRSRRHLGAAPTQDRTRAPSRSARPKKERACRVTHEPARAAARAAVGAAARAPPVSARAAVGAIHADSSQVDSSQVGSRRRASRLGRIRKVGSMCVCEVFVLGGRCGASRFSSWGMYSLHG